MYDVYETNPTRHLGEAGTLTAALDRIDEECRRIHETAATTGEVSAHRFEVRMGGTVLSWLMHEPDPTRPYQSVILDGLIDQETP